MNLRRQIIAGFGVLLVPLLLIALVAFAVIGRLGGAVDAVLAENDRSLRAVGLMDVSLERLRDLNRGAALGAARDAGSLARWGVWGVAGASLLALLLTAWAAYKLSGEIAERQAARSEGNDPEDRDA